MLNEVPILFRGQDEKGGDVFFLQQSETSPETVNLGALGTEGCEVFGVKVTTRSREVTLMGEHRIGTSAGPMHRASRLTWLNKGQRNRRMEFISPPRIDTEAAEEKPLW